MMRWPFHFLLVGAQVAAHDEMAVDASAYISNHYLLVGAHSNYPSNWRLKKKNTCKKKNLKSSILSFLSISVHFLYNKKRVCST